MTKLDGGRTSGSVGVQHTHKGREAIISLKSKSTGSELLIIS